MGHGGVAVTWVAHLVRTQDGAVGAELNFSSSTGTWDIPLNGTESWDLTVQRDQLRRTDPEWWFPWRASVLMSWKNSEGVLDPWLLGPITNLPEEDRDDDTAKLPCSGLGELLSRRIVTDRDFSPAEHVALAESSLRRDGLSYGAIAQDIITAVTSNRVGGQLPIAFASPRESGSRLRSREYYGYNVANNDAEKLITALTNVINGPDIMFRPRFTDSSQTFVEWAMVHGTHAQHNIEQTWAMDLDTTSSRSPVSTVSPKTDSGNLVNKVYWTGAGEDEGTLIRMAVNRRQLASGMPLMEGVGSDSDSENPSLIQDRAETAIEVGSSPLQQLTIDIDGSDPRSEIGRWRVGDSARVTVGDDWLSLAPGSRMMKIIAAKGRWDETVTLEFQEVLM